MILIIADNPKVINIPKTPLVKPIINVSALNRYDTSFFLPPNDLITPISLTLSTTDT